jgi:hypothetical protein
MKLIQVLIHWWDLALVVLKSRTVSAEAVLFQLQTFNCLGVCVNKIWT